MHSPFVGRKEQLASLDYAWEDPNTNVVCFHGFGGRGKTMLLSHWLQTMSAADWRGAERIVIHSFSRSAEREHQMAPQGEQFLEIALREFRLADASLTSSWQRGEIPS